MPDPYDWYIEYNHPGQKTTPLRDLILKFCARDEQTVILGSGNSTLPGVMYRYKYIRIQNEMVHYPKKQQSNCDSQRRPIRAHEYISPYGRMMKDKSYKKPCYANPRGTLFVTPGTELEKQAERERAEEEEVRNVYIGDERVVRCM